WVSGESLTVHLSSCLRPHFPSVATDGLICDSGVKLGDGSSDLSSSNSPFVLTLSFSFSEHFFLSISFCLSLLHTCSHTHPHTHTHTHPHTHGHTHPHTYTHIHTVCTHLVRTFNFMTVFYMMLALCTQTRFTAKQTELQI